MYRPEGPAGSQLNRHLEEIEVLLDKHAGPLGVLVREHGCAVVVQVVREIQRVGADNDLGFGLDAGLIKVMAEIGATFDMDEYDE